jgi:polyisoprenoid-binding protein YceI
MTLTETTPIELTGNYTLDVAHTRLGFSARHAMVSKVHGSFTKFEGSGYIDSEKPENSHFELTINVESIDTGNPDRDKHLRTNDFLAVDQYPEITFRSTEVERVGVDRFKVTGDLAIRGVTRPVTLDFGFTGAAVDPWGNTRLGFEGGGTINRKDWGVNWNTVLDGGGVMVSDKVNLEFDVEVVKSQA